MILHGLGFNYKETATTITRLVPVTNIFYCVIIIFYSKYISSLRIKKKSKELCLERLAFLKVFLGGKNHTKQFFKIILRLIFF